MHTALPPRLYLAAPLGSGELRRTAGLVIAVAVMLTSMSAGADLKVWYRAPATKWMTEALPIGNGRMGAMVFGGVAHERIQYNEKTLWSGGPFEKSDYAGGNLPGGAEHIGEIQNLLRENHPQEAQK